MSELGDRARAAAALEVVVANDRREIQRLAELVERFGETHRLSAGDVVSINLVLEEVVLNIIRHGYDDAAAHEIRVRVAVDEGKIVIRIEDDGRAFDPLAAPAPDLDEPLATRPIGGLGVHIVRSIAETAEYRRDQGRNVLSLSWTPIDMSGA